MKTMYAYAAILAAVLLALASLDRVSSAQTTSMAPQSRSTIAQSLTPPAVSLDSPEAHTSSSSGRRGEAAVGAVRSPSRKLPAERSSLTPDSPQELYRYSALTRPQVVDFVGVAGEPNTWMRLLLPSAT